MGASTCQYKNSDYAKPLEIQLSISLAKALWSHIEFGRLKNNPHVTWSCILWLSLNVPSLGALSASRTCHWSTQACCTWCWGTSSLLKLQASLLSGKKNKKTKQESVFTHLLEPLQVMFSSFALFGKTHCFTSHWQPTASSVDLYFDKVLRN